MADDPMVSATVQLLNDRTAIVSNALEVWAKQLVKATAEAMVTYAKQVVPVDTGYLQSTISAVIASDGLSATVQATAPYAKFVEFGTYKMAAQPFMTPAEEYARQKFQAGLKAMA